MAAFRVHNNIGHTKEEMSKENVQPKQNQAGHKKRPVLGNVTNQLRRQPERIAKGKLSIRAADGQENVKVSKAGSSLSSFAIFEDAPVPSARIPQVQHIHEDEPMHDQENLVSESDLVLNETVASLNQIRCPRYRYGLKVGQPAPPTVEASPMFVDEICRNHDSPARLDEFGLDPYFKDIYSHMRAKECVSRPTKDYMNHQNDVTTSMRNILVDWLVEVCEEYKLQRETLFLAINYIDRVLSLAGVFRPKLQLVGAASMFIAAKYEEIYPPDVAEFVYITDDTYTKDQVIKMESVILKMLEFKVSAPTINWFCERFIDLLEMTEKAKFLSFFLAELSLIEIEEFLVYRPSVIAASAVILARSVLKLKDPWPKHMEQASCYTLSELKPCIQQLHLKYTQKEAMPQQAVIEKYKQQKYGSVSTIESSHVLAIF